VSTPADALACAVALVDALAAAGVDGFVVSPGSRSTPLTLAIARSDLSSWIVLDERSAAFFALGRASMLGAPVAVVCTSGTAAANLLPALVEASQRRVPLVALTADRPPELHGVGANQTIPQEHLYPDFVRASLTLPVASAGEEDAWRVAGRDAALRAQQRPRGPVHLNAPFREPFLPTTPGEQRHVTVGAARALDPVIPAEADVALVQHHIDAGDRIVVHVGGCDEPIDADALRVACDALGATLVTDAVSGIGGNGPAVCGTETARTHLRPDLLLQLGRAPTTRAAQGLIDAARTLITVDPDGWRHDPSRPAERTITASPVRLLTSLTLDARDRDGTARWRGVSDAVARTLRTVEDEHGDALWEGSIARIVAATGAVIVAGNSTPVRDLDTFRGANAPRVVANRGASGIDGLVSTLAGVASAGQPTIGLLGDLSVLHDASGLIWLAAEHAGTLVVVDNDGGGIFDLLAGASLPEHERWFITPHGGRLPRLLEAAGVTVRTVTSRRDLEAALADVSTEPPMRILHVRVDRAQAVRIRATVREQVERAAAEALAAFER
jgi:2-succinyl-5-enolpyruvyl-6-hydroxy-3-cyclohexene-1-carboxylate synthase